MGKEIIVDPTDTLEELTAEQLSATDSVLYRDECKQLDILRLRIRSVGIKPVAKGTGLGLRSLRKFVNEGTRPNRRSIDRLRAYFDQRGRG